MRLWVPLKNKNPGLAWYYRLHGAMMVRGVLRFTLNRFTLDGKDLFVWRDCDYLNEDMTCQHWNDGRRPSICKDFGEKTMEGFYIHEGCGYTQEMTGRG